MFFRTGMVKKSGQIIRPFCHNARVWQKDGRTKGQTDRRTNRQNSHRSTASAFHAAG